MVNFIYTLIVIILVRLDWYFQLFVRLYKPFSEQFVKENINLKHSPVRAPVFGPHILSSLSSFSLSRQPNTPFEDDNSKDVWLKPLNLEEEGCRLICLQVILCVSRSRYCAVMFQTFKTRFKSYLMYFHWSILGKILGFSVFLVVDTLTSISCHLRAIGGRLNSRFQL